MAVSILFSFQKFTKELYLQTFQNMDNTGNKEEHLEGLSDVLGKTPSKEIAVKEDLCNYKLWQVHYFLLFPELFLIIPEVTVN